MARDFMSGKYTCKYCGDEIEMGKGVHNGGVIVKERFCSKLCQNKWNKMHSDSEESKSGGSNSKDKSPEQIMAEAEAQRLAQEQEELKKERRKAKAQELKEEGKVYSAFITQFGENIGFTSVFLVLVGAFFLIPGYQNGVIWMCLVGYGVPAIFIVLWSFLGVKYFQEYFRK